MSGGGNVSKRQADGVPPISAPHISVLLDEVVAALAPQSGEVHVDGTFGAGGARFLPALTDACLENLFVDEDAATCATDKISLGD